MRGVPLAAQWLKFLKPREEFACGGAKLLVAEQEGVVSVDHRGVGRPILGGEVFGATMRGIQGVSGLGQKLAKLAGVAVGLVAGSCQFSKLGLEHVQAGDRQGIRHGQPGGGTGALVVIH
ncbi:MAG: hypothetical protein JWN86_1805 [Planctomycetota bacterium]|nr:hypothetical protein [Planctomycetota bacterium]